MSDEPDLGPDDRDRNLLDGSWEQRYYTGAVRTRDWRSIGIGLGLFVLLAMIVPLVMAVVR